MENIKTIMIEPVNPDFIINTLNKIDSDFADIILNRKVMMKIELLRMLNTVRVK